MRSNNILEANIMGTRNKSSSAFLFSMFFFSFLVPPQFCTAIDNTKTPLQLLSHRRTHTLFYKNSVLEFYSPNNSSTIWESFNHSIDAFITSTMAQMNINTIEAESWTFWKTEDLPWPGKGTFIKPQPIGIEARMDESYQQSYNKSKPNFKIRDRSRVKIEILPWDQGKDGRFGILYHEDTEACGPFGVRRKSESHICGCLKGFIPKSMKEWSKGNWRDGCVRRAQLLCQKNFSNSSLATGAGKEDKFLKISGMKLPDRSENIKLGAPQECQSWCMKNCSCVAYAFVDGIGCMIWATKLLGIHESSLPGVDLFLRLAYSEIGEEKHRALLIFNFTAISSIYIIILCTAVYGWFRWKANQRVKHAGLISGKELPMFDFDSILDATNNFSITNKLGQGGFGPVYKGKLQDGKEIAVKRLSNSSRQGIEEFKNEIRLIPKLQHRNLVKLLGCCNNGENMLLIYEYLSNKSLDAFLFDSTKKAQLDWAKRFNIILGITRGLLYLHRDSCLRVIHRDLKASNILLDEDMNPKISDFGLAQTFQDMQGLANTQRIAGTFGYMPPEYTMRGIFSEKSDVFSFGVLLLEIVSGKKNTSFHNHDQHLNLLDHAWQLWNQGRGLDLLDQALSDSFSELQVMRCIHVGLLCVQDHAVDRPTMSTIVLLLNSEMYCPQPKQPTYILQGSFDSHLQSQRNSIHSINEVTLSIIQGR